MTVKTPSLLLAVVLLFASSHSAAAPSTNPEEIVRQDVAALSRGDVDGLAALFAEDAQVFLPPTDPRRLVGALSTDLSGREQMRRFLQPLATQGPPQRYEVIDMTSIGELVVARLKVTAPPDYARPAYRLVVYRVQDGLIRDLWHVARSESASVIDNAPARAVIEQLVDANNRGHVEAFLALFDRDARNLRRAEIPFRLSDERSDKIVDHDSRGRFFRAMFANGAPVQVEPVQTLVFGDLVIAREKATRPDGKVLDELSIYRVRDGRIQDDWFVAITEHAVAGR